MTLILNGTTGISDVDGSASSPAIRGTDSNTGISFGSDVIIGSTGGVERWRTDASGRVLVGTSTSIANGWGGSGSFQLASNSFTVSQIYSYTSAGADGYGSYFELNRARGTQASPSVVTSGDELGEINFYGYDGSGFIRSASIRSYVDGTPGTNDMPGRLVFSVTRDGQSSPAEALRINNAGYLKASYNGSYVNSAGAWHEMTAAENGSDLLYLRHAGTTNPFGIEIQFSGAAPNNTSNWFLYCYDTGTNRAVIRANGGLANFQANNVNLSDRNAKKDISPAADTWNCIKEWEIVNYRYKDQPDDADLNLGVIAQQVAESCPEVITVFEEAKEAKPAVLDEDGNEVEPAQKARPEKLGVKEQQMYWMAIKALQEAQVRIEQLEAKVAALEAA